MAFPTFAAWAAMYGKVYNGEEAVNREAIYNDNIKYIQANDVDGVMGVNMFADMTNAEFRAQYTGFSGKPAHTDSVYLGRHTATGKETPSEIDWSTQGAVSPVKDQGSCGSCWAFSAVGSLEGRVQIAKGSLQQFSEQQLVDCDHNGDLGCNGGLMDTAFEYLEGSKGVCTEASYGYKGKGGTCGESKCTVGLAASDITGFKDVDGTEQALQEAVAEGPVSVAVSAMTSFQLYTGGIIKSPLCLTLLDHGVLAVGYGVDGGTKYWKVKNSWGKSWGEKGYVRIQKGKGGKGECGILSGPPSYPVISTDVTV